MNNKIDRVVIFTEPPDKITNMIGISDADFVSLIDEDKQSIIFKYIKANSVGVKNFCFYVLKEGFCFQTSGFHLENFQQFYDTVKLASEKGFSHLKLYFHSQNLEIENGKDYYDFLLSDFYSQDNEYNNIKGFEINKSRFKEFVKAKSKGFINRKDYLYAIEIGIQNYVSFKEFIDSGFTKIYKGTREMKKDYPIFLKAKENGFMEINDYELAEELGIKNYQELEIFIKSGFYDSDRYNNKENYKEFKKAMELGFNIKSSYEDALNLGFNNYDEYNNFLESGCKTFEEYQFKIKFPPILNKKANKIKEILNDANKAFDSMSYEEFFRLKYLSVEKIAEIAYMKIFKKELNKDNELKFDDIIISLDKRTENELVDLKELKYWRRLRNKVIHEHFKLNRDEAMRSKEFLDELYDNLNNL